jgi:hypothetical protein
LVDEPDGRAELVPYGIDINPRVLDHARVLQPVLGENFSACDLFAPAIWTDGRRYALALLMVGRLLETNPDRASKLLDEVFRCCDRLLVYVYPGWGGGPLDILARPAGLCIVRGRAHAGLAVRT